MVRVRVPYSGTAYRIPCWRYIFLVIIIIIIPMDRWTNLMFGSGVSVLDRFLRS